jgi:hypothetical protein
MPLGWNRITVVKGGNGGNRYRLGKKEGASGLPFAEGDV